MYTFSTGRARKNAWNRGSREAANQPFRRPASMELGSTSSHSETQCTSPAVLMQEERQELGSVILCPWATLLGKCLSAELWAERSRRKDVRRSRPCLQQDKRHEEHMGGRVEGRQESFNSMWKITSQGQKRVQLPSVCACCLKQLGKKKTKSHRVAISPNHHARQFAHYPTKYPKTWGTCPRKEGCEAI